MLGRLVLIFIAVPLLDLALLLRIGQALSLWPTVWLVILTGVLGAALARHEGLRTLGRINAELAAGRMPTSQLADALLILLAGAVLMTPGFLTDLFGLLLLLPPFRRILKRSLTRWFERRIIMMNVANIAQTSTPSSDDFEGSTNADAGAPRPPMKYVENKARDK